MTKPDADILEEARIYLEVNGWWRGSLRGPNGRQTCGMGAVVYSQGWQSERHPNGVPIEHQGAVNRLLVKVLMAVGKPVSVLGERYVLATGEFTRWNDHEVKDKQAVLDAFAKAEKIERAGFDPDA